MILVSTKGSNFVTDKTSRYIRALGVFSAVVLIVVASAVTGGQSASAQLAAAQVQVSADSAGDELTESPEIPILPLDVLIAGVSEIHPDVLAVLHLRGTKASKLIEQLSIEYYRLERAIETQREVEADQLVLTIQIGLTAEALQDWRMTELERRHVRERARLQLIAFAADSFRSDIESILDDQVLGDDVSPIPTLFEHARLKVENDLVRATGSWEESKEQVADLLTERESLVRRHLDLNLAWSDSSEGKRAAMEEIERLTPQLEASTILASVDGLGFPVLVLDAYYRAELAIAKEFPACSLSWNQLAGIGRVETIHGTFGGASVSSSGAVVPHILGIVLDGTRSSAVPDTDGGIMDGNVEWDRAVGPMQFIPGSWDIFASDGNDDGASDPHNIYDAALASAKHLCRSHTGIQQQPSFTRSLFGYNRSLDYGIAVSNWANTYGRAVQLGTHYRAKASPEILASTDIAAEE